MSNTYQLITENQVVDNPEIKGLSVFFLGDNNIVKIHTPIPSFENCKISLEEHSEIEIGASDFKIKNLQITKLKKNCSVRIGRNFSCEGVLITMHGEIGRNVSIGDECMFSSGIELLPSDMHGIYDCETKKPLNMGGDIIVKDHVWIGKNVIILKKSIINENCVIGINSIVHGTLLANCIYAGGPVKLIRKQINWSRKNCQYLEKGDFND